MPWIRTLEQDVRNYAANRNDKEEDHTENRENSPVERFLNCDEWVETIRNDWLETEVKRAHSEACKCSYVVHYSDIRLLEVGNYWDAVARCKPDVQTFFV